MKSQKGIALITILVIIVVIFAFALGISMVIDKNLKLFSSTARKATSRSLAKSAVEYMSEKTDTGISWALVSGTTYTTGEIQMDSDRPYYFEIRDTCRISTGASGTEGEYQFIGILKDSAGGKEISRTILRVPKGAPDFKNSWTE